MIKIIEKQNNESSCKEIQAYRLTDTDRNDKIFVDFEIIDTDNTASEYLDKLGIIKGDVHTLCNGVVKQCCIITNYAEEFDAECMETMCQFVSHLIVPVFFIIDKEYKGGTLKDAFSVIGKLTKLGFQTADCISDFENNFMLISAERKICKQIFNNYFKRNQYMFENIEPGFEELSCFKK